MSLFKIPTFLIPARRSAVAVAVVAACAASLSVGCSVERGDSPGASAASSTTTPAPAAPVASVRDGQADVNPAEPVTVKAIDGTLTQVSMVNENGREVQAELAADGRSWTTAEPLGYYRTYTLVAETSVGTELKTTFTTATPAATSGAAISPLAGSTVGVGQVISFVFNQAVPDRAAAEKAITVTTNPPVEGAFFWLNGRVLRWRPKEFWQPGTEVSVVAKLYGTDLGGGLYGGDDNETNFTIGDAVIATADDATKTLSISRNGVVEKTMPISMGRDDKYATPNGTYVIGERHEQIVMDSSTYGLDVNAPDGYRTDVKYATQMSWSGIYVHAAPWSVWAQGNTNVSHGCLNVSTENAQWFFENMRRGDVVQVKNTTGPELNGYDGLGDWMIPWSTWAAGNSEG